MKAEDFGNYLRSLRKKRKLTVRQLDMYSGVSHSYISQMERGVKGIPSPDILKKLAKPLDIDYEDLMEKAGYITKEEILKAALPSIQIEHGLQKSFDDFFQSLKDNPDDLLSYMDEEDKKWFVDLLINEIKNQNIDYYKKITSEVTSEKEQKIMKLIEEVNSLPDDTVGQVVDFIKFLKSKDQ